jgi:UDP-3-O-[3-hydroxymyristoyl] N-acetylglucosamine deacetylase
MSRQQTLKQKCSCSGIGVHSGRTIKLQILPAPENSGITFLRTDLKLHPEIRAHVDNVVDTTLATTLGLFHQGERITVATVEHLLAALYGMRIDNACILVDGPEVPIMDGSSGPFVEMLQAAGIEQQKAHRRYLTLTREIKVGDGQKEARIRPSSGFKIVCTLDFDHPLIMPSPYKFVFDEQRFVKDIAYARTFGFLRDVEALRAKGLALGGSLDNAIVIDQYRVLNEGGLRYPNEFVRHKILDAIGDLSLFGMPILGRARLFRSGHALNRALVQSVLADPKNYKIIEAQEEIKASYEQPSMNMATDPIFLKSIA